MRSAKAGAWWEDAAQRAMANNSAVYTGGYGVLVRRVLQGQLQRHIVTVVPQLSQLGIHCGGSVHSAWLTCMRCLCHNQAQGYLLSKE